MKCIKCESEIENDDNFCYNCGELTAHGYLYINSNTSNINILNGSITKKEKNISVLFALLTLFILIFIAIINIRGDNILKPYVILKNKIYYYQYGYNISPIKTDNKYNNIVVNNEEEAKNKIKKDFESQKWQCKNNMNTYKIEKELEEKYQIDSVSFCDINDNNVKKIKEVIDKTFELFPNTKGYLTNITITNSGSNKDYIAYFEPICIFINDKNTNYNSVNKTQILLNGYYFLNDKILNNEITNIVDKGFYVKDANYYSTIAHELGHYITFVCLLKENNINSLILVTENNKNNFEKILKDSDNSILSKEIVDSALNNYNQKYNKNLSKENYAKLISNYAAAKDKNGNIITEETIAEAIHDYYLHGDRAELASLEIIKIVKKYLGE